MKVHSDQTTRTPWQPPRPILSLRNFPEPKSVGIRPPSQIDFSPRAGHHFLLTETLPPRGRKEADKIQEAREMTRLKRPLPRLTHTGAVLWEQTFHWSGLQVRWNSGFRTCPLCWEEVFCDVATLECSCMQHLPLRLPSGRKRNRKNTSLLRQAGLGWNQFFDLSCHRYPQQAEGYSY